MQRGRTLLTMIGTAIVLAACSTDLGPRMVGTTAAVPPPVSTGTPRNVTLRSHLGGTLAGDPTLRAGERLRFVPARDERFVRKTPETLTLPTRVPYEGAQETQLFLLGYAVGYAAEVLKQST